MINAIVSWIDGIKAGWKAARRKWDWPASAQVERARVMIEQDLRWLCLDKKLEAVCERHLELLAPDWMSRAVTDISTFRREIGCDPHEKKAVAPSVPEVERLPIYVRGDEDFKQAIDLCKAIAVQNQQALSADAFHVYAMPALSYALHRIEALKKQRDDDDYGLIHF